MKQIAFSGLLVSVVLSLGCGGGETRAETDVATPEPTAGGQGPWEVSAPGEEATATPRGPAAMPAASCPMLVPDVTVASAELDGGASLTFTTTESEQVDDLRSRVRAMADHVEDRPSGGMGQGGMGQGGMGHGRGTPSSAPMPSARAQVVEVPGGARVELRAIDPAEVDALRERVREHGQAMRAGSCPMMRGGAATG